jgi:3-deoxy-D-manno-octulosonic-acid transferase
MIFVDRMGELSKLYAICDIAFVGGSLVPQGGHNPLEPAAFAKPILFGPDMSDFLEISTLLLEKGGAKQVQSKDGLIRELEALLKAPGTQRQMGRFCYDVFSQNRGAVSRIIENMENLGLV